MYNVAEQFTNTGKAGLEAWKAVVNASFDGVGKLAALNLQCARSVAKRGAEDFKSLSDVRDIAGLKELQKEMAVSAVSQSVAYSRRAYHISNDASSAVTQVLGGQLSQAGRGLVGVLQETRKNAPPAYDFTVSTGKSLVSMATSVLGNLGKVARPAIAASDKPSVKLIEKAA